jgi:hypothetical protein
MRDELLVDEFVSGEQVSNELASNERPMSVLTCLFFASSYSHEAYRDYGGVHF